MTRRIGILGGTFDPFHCGHLDVATSAQEALELTRMFVITSNIPPHRPQPFASAYHRFAMVSFAVASRPDWRAADLELRSETPSFTSGTLAKFHERGYAASELFFVIGADAFADIGAWRDYPAILDAAHFVPDGGEDVRVLGGVINGDPQPGGGGGVDRRTSTARRTATH